MLQFPALTQNLPMLMLTEKGGERERGREGEREGEGKGGRERERGGEREGGGEREREVQLHFYIIIYRLKMIFR